MKMRILSVAVLFSALSGCAGSDTVRINSESDASFERSLNAMQRTLNREEQTKLMAALLRIRMAGLSSAREARESVGGGQVLSADKMREEYVYLVPFVETQDEVFLKTIIPSRKATKRYQSKDDE